MCTNGMEKPFSDGHLHGGRKVTETLSLRFVIETKIYYSRVPTH